MCPLINYRVYYATEGIKPIFHLATLYYSRGDAIEAKTRIRQHDWLKLAREKIRREQVGSVPTFLSVRANKVAKSKISLRLLSTFAFFTRTCTHVKL